MAVTNEQMADFPRESPLDREYALESRIKLPRLGEVLVFRNQEGLRIMAKEKVQSSVEECRRDIQQAVERMKLNHPHLLQMLDYSAVKGTDGRFIVRGYYELATRNLAAEIEQRRKEGRPMVAEELRNLLIDILEIMSSLKDSKMIHGDIRPEYIIFDPETEVYKLADRLGDPSPPTLVQTRNIQKSKKLYLSPQLFYNLCNQHRLATQGRKDTQFESVKLNPYLSEGYSLGLVVLESALLEDLQGIYDLNSGKINEGVLDQRLSEFAERYEEKDVGLVRAVQDLLEVSEEERPDLHLLLTGLKSTPQNSDYGDEEEGDYIFKQDNQEHSGHHETDYNQNPSQNHQIFDQRPNQTQIPHSMMKTSHGVVIEEEDEEGSDTRQGLGNIFKEDQVQALMASKNSSLNMKQDPKSGRTKQPEESSSHLNEVQPGQSKPGPHMMTYSESEDHGKERNPKLSDVLGHSTQQSSENSHLRTNKGEEPNSKPSVPSISLSSISQNQTNAQSAANSTWEQNILALKARRDEMIADLQRLKEGGELPGYELDSKKPEVTSNVERVNIFKEEAGPAPANRPEPQKQVPAQVEQKQRDYTLGNKSGLSSSRIQNDSQQGLNLATPETTVEPEHFKASAPQQDRSKMIEKPAPSGQTVISREEKPPSRKQPHETGPEPPVVPPAHQNNQVGYQSIHFSSNGAGFNGSSSRRGDSSQFYMEGHASSQSGLANYSSKPGLYSTNVQYSSSAQIHQGATSNHQTEHTPSTQIKDLTPPRSEDTPNISTLQKSDGAFASRVFADSSPKPYMHSTYGQASNPSNHYSTLHAGHHVDLNQSFSPQFVVPPQNSMVRQPVLERDNSRSQASYTPTRAVPEDKRIGSTTPTPSSYVVVQGRDQGSSVSPTPTILREHQPWQVWREHTPDVHCSSNSTQIKYQFHSDQARPVTPVPNPSAPAVRMEQPSGSYSYIQSGTQRVPYQDDQHKQSIPNLRTRDINFSAHHPDIIRCTDSHQPLGPQIVTQQQGYQVRQGSTTSSTQVFQTRYDSSSNLYQPTMQRDVQITHQSRDVSPHVTDLSKGRTHHPLTVDNAHPRRESEPIVIRSRSNTPIRNNLSGVAGTVQPVLSDHQVDRSPIPVHRQSRSNFNDHPSRLISGAQVDEMNRHMVSQHQASGQILPPGYSYSSQSSETYTQGVFKHPGVMVSQSSAVPQTSYGYSQAAPYQSKPTTYPVLSERNAHHSPIPSQVGRAGHTYTGQTAYQHISSTPSPIRGSGTQSQSSSHSSSQLYTGNVQQVSGVTPVRYEQTELAYTRLHQAHHQGSESHLRSQNHTDSRQVLGALNMNTNHQSNSNLFQSGGQLTQKYPGGSSNTFSQYPQQVVRPPADAKVLQYYTSSKTTVYENASQNAVYRHPN